MSLPRRFRLSGKNSFKHVFQRPVVSADDCFKVLARANNVEAFRLGMAVSRKVDRRAVARNRLKRIIRESFRAHYAERSAPGNEVGTGADYVVLPRARAVSISNGQLFKQLTRHWVRLDRRMGILTGDGAEAEVTHPEH